MLYVKPIQELTWEDVDVFCHQRLPEGAYLDYKQDFPDRLERTIAAMANTFGGVILLGVSEDVEGKPILPLTGTPFERGLSERVMNVILSNITPPVFPEIAVCRNPSRDTAVLVIRIAQSSETPHAIHGNTKVYLRTGNRNTPEELANYDRIEWLLERRQRSELLRRRLYVRAVERCSSLYHGYRSRAAKTIPELTQGWLRLSLCPLYPQHPYKTPPELKRLYERIQINDYFSGGPFPLPIGSGRIAQDGVLLQDVQDDGEVVHAELNSFGLYFFTQTLAHAYTPPAGQPSRLLPATELFARLDQFLDSGARYLESLGCRGLVEFRVHLDRIYGCGLGRYQPDGRDPPLLYAPDPEVELSDVVLSGAVSSERARLIFQAAQRIAWAFGWDLNQGLLDRYYREKKQ